MAATVWIFAYGSDDFLYLVDRSTVRFSPISPLGPVDTPQVSGLVGPFVPDRDLVFVEVFDVGVALEKPKEFVDDGSKVEFLGREQGETIFEGVPDLGSENRIGARAGAIVPVGSFAQEALEEVQVRIHALGWLVVLMPRLLKKGKRKSFR